MKKFLFLLISGIASTAFSQNNSGSNQILGTVMDSLTQKPVEFANAALIDPSTGKPINGTVCNEIGKFVIDKVERGKYQVVISFVGYTSKKINVAIAEKKSVTNLGTVILEPSVDMLHEVVVQGEKTLVEEKVDRTIYNAEQDATTKGGDATDVLKRVPMLSVDMDGNVSLKGSSSVRVLINNKPSTITANSVADALKQIPADMIKAVEVITSPSAMYDAEGSAGIINIVLKKNTLEGFFVTVDGSAGTRGSNAGANASYRKGKMGFSLGGFERWQYNVISDFENEQTTRSAKDTVLNIQRNHNLTDAYNSQYTFSWDYDIDKNNLLNASIRYGNRIQNSYQNNLLTDTYQNETLTNSTERNVKTVGNGTNLDGSVGYTHSFSKKRRELNMLAIYSRADQNTDYTANIYKATNSTDLNRYRNENQGYNQEMSLQIDFQEPLKQNQLLEFGGKSTFRNVLSDYHYYIGQGDSGPFVSNPSPSLTNGFNYDQRIVAGYMSHTFESATGWSTKVGGRYEYTYISAHFDGSPNITIPSYGVLVPSVNISKKLSNGRQIRVSYNRRIVRPWLQALNPNLQASNSLNATRGNPNLKPEYADNYEIAYKTNIPKGTLNVSTYLRYNTNDIQPARILMGDTIVASYQNLGSEANYGLALFASVNFTERFTLNGGIDVIYRMLNNNSPDPILNATNSGVTQNYRMTGSYNFNKGWQLQLFAAFQGNSFNLQGYRTGLNTQSIAVRKDIMKKAASLGAGFDNFATPSFNIYNYLNSPYVTQRTNTTLHNLIFKVNFTYKIGRQLPEKKKVIKLKAEDSEN